MTSLYLPPARFTPLERAYLGQRYNRPPVSRAGRLRRCAAFARMQCASIALEREFGYMDPEWPLEDFRDWLRRAPGYADWAVPLLFAPSINNATGTVDGGAGSSVTHVGYTPTSGSNGVLVVFAALTDNNGTDVFDTFTYDGNNLTQSVVSQHSGGTEPPTPYNRLCYLNDPTSVAASGDVVASRTGNVNGRGLAICTLLDAAQTGPGDTAVEDTDAASPYTVTINVTDADALVVCAVNYHQNTAFAPSSGAPQAENFDAGGTNIQLAMGSFAPGATGNQTPSWDGASEESAQVAAAWHPAAGGVTNQSAAAIGLGVADVGPQTVFKPLISTGTGTAVRAVTVFKTLVATGTGIAAVTSQKIADVAADAIALGTATVATVTTYLRTLSATGLGLAEVATLKTFFRTFAAIGTGTARRTVLVLKTLTATGLGVASLTAQKLAELALAAIGLGSAAVSLSHFRTLAAIADGVAASLRTTLKTFSATAAGVAALTSLKLLVRTFSAVATGAAALARQVTYQRALDAAVAGLSAVQRLILVTFPAVAAGIAARLITTLKNLAAVVVGLATEAHQVIEAAAGAVTAAATAAVTAAASTVYTQFFAPWVGMGGLGMVDSLRTRWQRRRRGLRRNR